jgi:hypothetical protein
MKTLHVKRAARLLGTAFLFSFILSACSKDDMDTSGDNTYRTSGNASGSQQSPPVTTSGSGTLSGTYNATSNVWNYDINWTALAGTVTAVEIHGPATAGVNGQLQVALTVTAPGINGNAKGSVTLTEQQEAMLLADQLYYTVVSAVHATGEIRGQIDAQAN